MVRVTLSCGGQCGAPEPSFWLRKNFRGISGGTSGFGSFVWEDVEDVAAREAPGWMVADPYTQVTYCPTCWAQLEADIATEDIGAAPTSGTKRGTP